MTAAIIDIQGARNSLASQPADTNEATLFTAGKKGATLVGIVIANSDGSARAATVKWSDGATDYDIYSAKSIAANDSLVQDLFIEIPADGTVKITAGTVDVLTFTITVIENVGTLGRGGRAN